MRGLILRRGTMLYSTLSEMTAAMPSSAPAEPSVAHDADRWFSPVCRAIPASLMSTRRMLGCTRGRHDPLGRQDCGQCQRYGRGRTALLRRLGGFARLRCLPQARQGTVAQRALHLCPTDTSAIQVQPSVAVPLDPSQPSHLQPAFCLLDYLSLIEEQDGLACCFVSAAWLRRKPVRGFCRRTKQRALKARALLRP